MLPKGLTITRVSSVQAIENIRGNVEISSIAQVPSLVHTTSLKFHISLFDITVTPLTSPTGTVN